MQLFWDTATLRLICGWNVETQPSPCARKWRNLGKNNSNFSTMCVPCGCGSDPASKMHFLGRPSQSSTRCSGMGHGVGPKNHWKDGFGHGQILGCEFRGFSGEHVKPTLKNLAVAKSLKKSGKRRENLQCVSPWKTSWDLRDRRNKILGFGLGNDPGYVTSFWWVLFVAPNPRIL